MANLKLFASAVLATGLCSLPLAAQQTTSPSTTSPNTTTDPSTQQSAPAQTMPGNHSDPNASVQTGDGQKPTNDNPDPGAGQGTGNAHPGGPVPVQHTASAPEVNNAQLRPVRAELVGKLDSKNAKAGDPVVLKTTDKATIGDGVVIPKGSKIKGQVVDSKPHDGTNKNAQLTLQFTEAELKGGQTVPIQSVLQSVSPAEANSPAPDSAPTPSGVMGGGNGAPGSATAAGGGSAPMAGSAGANPGTNGSAGVTGSQTAQAQGNLGTPQSTGASGANGTLAPGTVVAQQGNVQVKTTAVPGVLVEANADGKPFSNASGALLGAGQNVHLDGGTKVDLAIAQTKGPEVGGRQ
jgi:hypothetical protein